MIVRMAKIAVMGPRELLLDVLAHIEHLGILQIDRESKPGQLKEIETVLQSVVLDRESLGQRFLYENLLQKIDGLLAYLPPGVGREYYLDNASIAQFLSEVIGKHLETLRGLDQEQKQLGQTQKELEAARLFLEAISPLFPKNNGKPILDYIGISIRDPQALTELQQHLQQAFERGDQENFSYWAQQGGANWIQQHPGVTPPLMNFEQQLRQKMIQNAMGLPPGTSVRDFVARGMLNYGNPH